MKIDAKIYSDKIAAETEHKDFGKEPDVEKNTIKCLDPVKDGNADIVQESDGEEHSYYLIDVQAGLG